MPKVNFNIIDPNPEDQKFCKELALKFSPDGTRPAKMAEMLHMLVKAYQNQEKGQDPKPENTAQIEELNTELAAAKTTIEDLIEQVNQGKSDLLVAQSQVKQAEIKLPSFIFTPDQSQFKHMQRYFALMRKQGKITSADTDLPQKLTQKAITYFIKNEFPEVL